MHSATSSDPVSDSLYNVAKTSFKTPAAPLYNYIYMVSFVLHKLIYVATYKSYMEHYVYVYSEVEAVTVFVIYIDIQEYVHILEYLYVESNF